MKVWWNDFYGKRFLNFLELDDVTNTECQLNGLGKLVSIVSQLIIQNVKSPKQVCRKKRIDDMRKRLQKLH